jgi:hypothetical protein
VRLEIDGVGEWWMESARGVVPVVGEVKKKMPRNENTTNN